VRPLEALIAKWRATHAEYADIHHATLGLGWKACADELAALLQAAATPAPTAERIMLAALRHANDEELSTDRGIGAQAVSSFKAGAFWMRGFNAEPTPAAPAAPTAEQRRPLPPEVLADALQDRIGPTSGKLIRATPVRAAPPERVSEGKEP
jgi:hypothetical protein